ncbi:MAG TPA: DUF1573 domain-containing protein [Blastocatellia bacterium]|nr:DUF1573 domain-containing protein [Blastocatellia bacterium]
MKIRRVIHTFALVALLVIPAAAQQSKSPNQPNSGGASSATPLMVIDSFTHDFGEVKAGTPLRYSFKVKNQGKADLVINNVSPG